MVAGLLVLLGTIVTAIVLRTCFNSKNPRSIQIFRRYLKQTIRAGENNLGISGMTYKSASGELFLADGNKLVLRAIHVRENAELRVEYKDPNDISTCSVFSVCHMSDPDTLLVCLFERGADQKSARWLVALSRNDSEWRKVRVQTDGDGNMSCPLSGSRVLIGQRSSTYMELFRVERVESGLRIVPVDSINVGEEYLWFSATSARDTFVAMSYLMDNFVRVHRLVEDLQKTPAEGTPATQSEKTHFRLEELDRIQMNCPHYLLWLADRLLVADFVSKKKSHSVIELEMTGNKRFKRPSKLIATSKNIHVHRLCAVNDKLAIFDSNSKNILHYSFSRPLMQNLFRRLRMLNLFRRLRMLNIFKRPRMHIPSDALPLLPLKVTSALPAVHADRPVSFTLCPVKYKEQSGNGAIYGCEYPEGTFRTLFITSFLEISNVNEITDVCLVFDDKTIGNQNLTPDWVKWLWTSPVDKFNVTVIEFSPTALTVLSRTKYERLKGRSHRQENR